MDNKEKMKTILINTLIMKTILVSIILLFAVQHKVLAQEIASPKMTADGKNIKITYGQPSKRGRVIFGNLVPYGEVWRTGANEATEITFSKNVIIDKNEIEAGTYTLCTLPLKDKWLIILNSKLNQSGDYNYDKTKKDDQLKSEPATEVITEVAVKKSNQQEKLIFSFKDNSTGTTLTIAWDDVKVELPIIVK
jgi:hypothetical protein